MKENIREAIHQYLPQREVRTHKGNYGKLFLLAGSQGMSGAAQLAALSSLRSGIGLVYLGVPKSLLSIVESQVTEAISIPFEDKDAGFFRSESFAFFSDCDIPYDAVAIGPGIGRQEETLHFVEEVVEKCSKPLVIDADGLFALTGKLNDIRKRKAETVLTPHEGEFKRLFRLDRNLDPEDRKKTALEASREANAIIVLKGYQTIVASPDGSVYENDTGNPGMATAGSGDVLLGILATFLARKVPAFEAACLAVYLHGLAGDLASREVGEESLIASDLIKYLPKTFLTTYSNRD